MILRELVSGQRTILQQRQEYGRILISVCGAVYCIHCFRRLVRGIPFATGGTDSKTSELLGIDKDIIEKNYMDLSIERKIIMKQSGDQTQIYSASFYYMEANTATMLRELDIAYDVADAEIEQRIHNIEKQTGMQLDEHQVQAVKEGGTKRYFGHSRVVRVQVKTTTINTIIRYFEMEGMDIFLAAQQDVPQKE